MKTFYDILSISCGIWLLIVIPDMIWFVWLYYKGELIEDVPDDLVDIF